MPELDHAHLLALLRDPNVESGQIAAATGASREEAGRAARLVLGIARAKPEEAATLPAPLAGAVLCAAETAGRIDLLAALAACPAKAVAKEAKRRLHHLKARGRDVPEAPRPPPPAPAPLPAEPPPAAYASMVDGRGERAVWLPRAVPGRGLEVAQAVLSDEQGLVELHLGLLGRKEWRTFVKGLLERGADMGVAEIDRGRAHALVSAARALNERSGARPPEGADHWLAQLGAPPPLPPPGAGVPPLAPEEAEAALAASGELHELPLLRGWLAEEPFLREVARELDEAEASPVEAPPEARRDRLAALVAEAAERYLTPARRARLAARLLEVADHLAAAGDAAHARSAAASAQALSSGRPAAENPFARRLVEQALPFGDGTDGAGASRRPTSAGPATLFGR